MRMKWELVTEEVTNSDGFQKVGDGFRLTHPGLSDDRNVFDSRWMLE
jgi:hypothetical protein